MQHYSFGGRKILYADEATDPPGPPPIRKEDRVISRRQRELERERREAGDTEPAPKVQEVRQELPNMTSFRCDTWK